MINRKYYLILKHLKGVSSDLIEGEITLEQAIIQFLNMYFPGAQALFPAQKESNFQGEYTNHRYTVDTTASKYKLVVIHQEDDKAVIKPVEKRLTDIEKRLTDIEKQRHPAITKQPDTLAEGVICTKCGIEWKGAIGYCCPHLDCPMGAGPTTC